MTGFDLPQNFHSDQRVTFEEDASLSRITSEITLGSRTSHRIVVSFSSYGLEDNS